MKRVFAGWLVCCTWLPGLACAATVSEWPLPAPSDSAQPNLSVAPDGDRLLSWIERRAEGGHRLMFARQETGKAWTPPRSIAQGDDWFVNWADFPALQALPDGSLWAHTLVKSAQATYAYDVRLFASRDGGNTWTATAAVHEDGTPTEHGFASLWPQGRDGLGIAWLDGRNTGGGHDHDSHGSAGAMTLRAAVFGPDETKRSEHEVDPNTCDCCQTDAALSDGGTLLAWRDRSEGEIRDVVVARFDGKTWAAPVTVHADRWVMPACPVNGPAIAARGHQAWVAWYTGAGGTPSIRIAGSDDGGRHFGPMRELARGDAQHGRVDVAADASGVWVSWLEEQGGRQSLWLARYGHDLAAEHFRLKVADLAGRGRGTGFPRLQLGDGSAWLAWTEIESGKPRLRGARVRP